jgi:hypothetical protein
MRTSRMSYLRITKARGSLIGIEPSVIGIDWRVRFPILDAMRTTRELFCSNLTHIASASSGPLSQ